MSKKITKRPRIGCVVRATGKALRFFSAVLFVTATMSMTACSAEYDEPEMDVEIVNVPGINAVSVEPQDLALIERLVEMSFWCNDLSDALKAHDERAWSEARDVNHHCLSCKLYALKFFSVQPVFGDTSVGTDEWDDFNSLLSMNSGLKKAWNSIKF